MSNGMHALNSDISCRLALQGGYNNSQFHSESVLQATLPIVKTQWVSVWWVGSCVSLFIEFELSWLQMNLNTFCNICENSSSVQEHISCLLQQLCHMANSHQTQWHQRMIIYLAYSSGLACDFSGLGLRTHLQSAACGGLVDWHLLRDGTGEDDNFDSALLTISHAPEDFSRSVFMEKSDKQDRMEARNHFSSP